MSYLLKFQKSERKSNNLLAMAVGIKQKKNVCTIVEKVQDSLNADKIWSIQWWNWVCQSPNFPGFSFFQRILLLFCSTTMETLMGGQIWNGVEKLYI